MSILQPIIQYIADHACNREVLHDADLVKVLNECLISRHRVQLLNRALGMLFDRRVGSLSPSIACQKKKHVQCQLPQEFCIHDTPARETFSLRENTNATSSYQCLRNSPFSSFLEFQIKPIF